MDDGISRALRSGFDGTDPVAHVHPPAGGVAFEPADAPTTRRFYFELVAMRQCGDASKRTPPPADASIVPAAVLADPKLAPALAALRDAADDDRVRIACLIELGAELDQRLVSDVQRARDALARHDIALDLWPQLADAGSRFLNTSTAARFQERMLPLLDELGRAQCDVGLALDLEPNESLSKSAWSARTAKAPLLARARALGGVVRSVSRALLDARQGRRDLMELARDLSARNMQTHVAVLPPLTATPGRDAFRHWALGCPAVDDDGQPLFNLQAAMCYATMVHPSPTKRDEQRRLLALWAARHRTSFDAVVVGQTCTGILGDEPVYDDPRAFAEDVRAMHALGYSDVGVYALEGLWFGKHGVPDASFTLRDDVELWLDAAFGR